jgi:hypothetical protein
MATQVIKTLFQLRRGTEAEWALHKDVIPAVGEPCFVIDKNILKIGDGVTTFENLEPIGGVKLEVSGDGKSVVLEDGVFKLAGFDAAAVGAQPRKSENGDIEWVVPSTTDIDELKSNVSTIQSNMTVLEQTVTSIKEIVAPSGDDSIPLLSRIETLEEKMDGEAEGSVDAKIDAKINEFAKEISDNGTVDTLKELIDYVANHGNEFETVISDIVNLKKQVGDEPVQDQIAESIANSGHISKTEAEATLMSKMEAASTLKHVKYEISHKPVGTLVDYREKEIRVMCPADTKWEKQTVGGTGNANMYYMGFKAYAPEGAVSFKEGDRGAVTDEMYTFDNAFAGTDEFGRNYSICWLALASYDEAADKWSYFGAKSTYKKYIGWDYVVEWYDANGVCIGADSIRINLSNEACHSGTEPYYMASVVKEVAVNGTVLDMVDGKINISVPEIKGSDEIEVAEDGTLKIKAISFDKITQSEDTTIVMDGGGASN